MKRNERPRDLSQQMMTTMRTRLRVPVTILLLFSGLTWAMPSYGLTLIKSNSVGDTLLAITTVLPATSYVQNQAPTLADTILFNNTISAATTYRVSNVTNSAVNLSNGVLNVGGLRVVNPGGAITIQNGNNQNQTINLGAQGIDMSLATQNLTISNATGGAVTLATAAAQTWKVANVRTLTIGGPIALGHNVSLEYYGGNTGGTAGIVTLGSTTTGISGVGNLNVTGMVGGSGGAVNLLGNNNTWTGALTVSGGAQVNLDQGAAGQNKLADAATVTLNRGTLNFQNTSAGTEVIGGLSLGLGLNQVLRGTGTGVLQAGAISRSTTGAALNVGNIGTTAGSSYLTTTSLNTNLILGGWAVAINGTTDTNFVKNATNAANGAVIAASGTDYTTQNTMSSWTNPAQNILINGTAVANAGASRTINSLKIAHTTATTAVTVDMGAGLTLTVNDGLNGGGIIRNQNAATTIGNATIGGRFLTSGGNDATADTLYLWNSQNTMSVNAVVQNNGAGALTLFSGGAGTVAINAANTYTGGTVIAAGTMNLGNNNAASDTASLGTGPVTNYGTLVIDKVAAVSAANGTIANNISGTGNLTINRGVITLSGSNTYSGDTTVPAATLRAGSSSSFSADSRIVLNNAASVLSLNGFNSSIAALNGTQVAAQVQLGANSLTLSGSDAARSGTNNQLLSQTPQAYQGVISGTGGLVKNGAYTQQLTGTGALSYSGSTTVNNGTLQVSKAMSTSSLTVNGGAFIADTGAALNSVTALNMAGGTVTINAANSLNGLLNLNIGTGASFISNQANLIPDAAAVSLTGVGASLQLGNGLSETLGSVTSSQNSRLLISAGPLSSTVTINDAAGTRALDGVFTMSGPGAGLGNLIFSGVGLRVLGGGNAYNGSTAVNAGSLQVATGAVVEVLPDQTALVLANVAGVQLNLNNKNETIGSLAGGGAVGGNVALGSGLLTVGQNGTSTTFSGVVSGTGSLTKLGNGILTLDGASSFTGGLTIRGGKVILSRSGGGTLSDAANVLVSGPAGAALELTTSDDIGRLTSLANSVISIGSGATLTTNHSTLPNSIRLGNVDTDTRVMTVVNGTDGLVPGMLVASTDGNTDVSAGTYIVQVLSHNTVLLSATPTSGVEKNFTFTGADQLQGAFTGAGNWVKNGAGTVVLGANSTLAGTMTINAGSVIAGGTSQGGRYRIHDTISNQASVVLGNATLNMASNGLNLTPFERIGSLASGDVNALVNLTGSGSSGVLALGGNNSDTSYVGRIRGSNTSWLVKEGGGFFDWTNADASVMDGTIHVAAGEMRVGGAEGLSAGSNVFVSNTPGAKLVLNTSDSGGETVSFISGGGRGATRAFVNGVAGSLAGTLIGGTGGEIEIGVNGLRLTNSSAGAVFSYGGVLTGAGSLDKQGNNALELLGTNTYAGRTGVRATASNTTSVIRMGAYGGSSGVGAPSGMGGFGALPATTDLEIAAGTSGLVNANAQFDLNGSTQTVRSLSSRELAGSKVFTFNGGTININNPSGTTANEIFSGVFDGLGTINVNGTHVDGWALRADTASPTFNSNMVHRGSLNVNAGKVILDGTFGSIGDTVHLSVGSTGQIQITLSDTVGSLYGLGSLVLDSTRELILTSAPQGSINTAIWSGSSSGNGGLTLRDRARIQVSSNQGYAGLTTVSGASSMILDYTQGGVNNIIPGVLRLAGGDLYLRGGAASTIVDSATSTQLGTGLNSISAESGMGGRINLGFIRRGPTPGVREVGSALEIRGAVAATTANDAFYGILGGYATYGEGANITTWAVGSSTGTVTTVTPLLDASYQQIFSGTDIALGGHADVKNDFDWNLDTGSLRFNTAPALPGLLQVTLDGNPGDIRIVESGGILVTNNVGENDILITGGSVALSGGSSEVVTNELILHQHNTRGSLIIESAIVNNPGNPFFTNTLSLTKTGRGKVILLSDNGYSGQTSILDGVLQLGGLSYSTGRIPTTPIINNGYLSLRHTSTPTEYDYTDIHGSGAVRVESQAVQVLSGANSTYSGGTYVVSGTLRVNNNTQAGGTGLGSTAGLTSVAPSGTLEVGTTNFRMNEVVYLRGGTLAGVNGATLLGSVLVGATSSLRSNTTGQNLTFSAPVITRPGANLTLSGLGNFVFNTTNSILSGLTSSSAIYVGGGPAAAGAPGSLGSGAITNNGSITLNLNDTHYGLSNDISGSGSLMHNRNVLHVTGHNTYSGPTLIGSNQTSFNVNADMRVGADTYTGRLGTGAITLQSSTGGQSTLRFMSLRNQTLTNTINLNPWSDGNAGARNAVLVRHSLGSLNLAGTVTAGDHAQPGQNPFTQRAVIQNDPNNKLTLSGAIVNGPGNRLNFVPVSNTIFEFAGSASNTLWGRFTGNNSDNTTSMFLFNNTGTTTLKGFNNFANTGGTNRLNNIYIQRGTVVVDHTHVDDPDAANTTQIPNGINDDADMYLFRGATLQFAQTETVGLLYTQKGSTIDVPANVQLTIDDNANQIFNGGISGEGLVAFNANGGAAWYGLFGASTFTNSARIGSSSQIVTVRVSDLINNSGLGANSVINLGVPSIIGTAPQEARLEYVSSSRAPHNVVREINLSNSGAIQGTKVSIPVSGPQNTIRLASVGGLELNMEIVGLNIAPGTTITGINTGTNEISISQNTLGAIPANIDLTFEDVSQSATVRIGSNGVAPLNLNGKIAITNLANKVLMLHGQNTGMNTVNGQIDQANGILSLTINPNVTNNDQYGLSRWVLTNNTNNFSGRVTVNLGTLELSGDLGTGTETIGILGDLTVPRIIDLGTTGSDGRRYDIFGSGDNLGGLGNQGNIVFNDPSAGTLTLGSNITFNQSYTGGAGAGGILNNGTKVVVINGELSARAINSSGALDNSSITGNSHIWVLGGSNTGDNTINGAINNNPATGGATVGVTKEGSGKWILNSVTNTMNGTITISRGWLEFAGGNAIGNDTVVNVTNAGSEGSAVGGSTLRIRSSETIGGLVGTIGAVTILDAGMLTVQNATQTYAGTITGGGGFTRTNNDTNARISTLTNLNTYTGPTRIITNGTNNVGNRIDVITLANAGQPSGIGAATADAANLVINTVNANGGLRFIGLSNSSTDRLMTFGASSAATTTAAPAAIWADGLVQGSVVPTVSFTGTGPVAFTASNQNSTLMLRGQNLGNNTFNPQITNNGTGVVNVTKVEQGNWVLGGDNAFTGVVSILTGVGSSSTTATTGGALIIAHDNALGTSAGGVTIGNFPGSANAGGGSGTGLMLRGGRTITGEMLTNNITDASFTADSGVNTWNGGVVLAGTNANLRLAASSNATLNVSGAISGTTGSGRLLLTDMGTKILSGANTYTGITAATGGTVRLDFAASDTSKFADASALELGWNGAGNILLLGTDADRPSLSYLAGMSGVNLELSGGTHTEIVSATTLNVGANYLSRSSGNSILRMNAITRAVGSSLDLAAASIANTDTNNVNSILGGGGITINKTDWATSIATGAADTAITALATYSNDAYATANNVNVVAFTTIAAASIANSLRFNGAAGGTLNINSTLSLNTAAGLLMTPASGNVILGGTGSIRNNANTAGLEALTIHQHSANALQINTAIVNNTAANAQGITKVGNGKVFLSGNNTFTGTINLHQGEIQVGGTIAAPTSATNSRLTTGAPAVNISQGAILRFLSNNTAIQDLGTLQGAGSIILDTGNSQTVLFDTDSSNYIGDIIVNGGKLRVGGSNLASALGNLRGATNINSGATLELFGAATATSGTITPMQEWITFGNNTSLVAIANGGTNTNLNMSGKMVLNNTTPGGFNIDLATSQALTWSGIVEGAGGFTKTGNGILTLTNNQFTGALDGQTVAGATPTLTGQILVNQGILRAGNPRAFGAHGVGNEVIIASGATVDLRGQSMNYGDDPSATRKIFRVAGTGVNNTGVIINTTGTGQFSHLVLTGNATLSGGGFLNGSRLDLSSYDNNPNNGSTLDGNFTRNFPTLDGNNNVLTIIGSRQGEGVVLHQPTFTSPLSKINLNEGILRLEMDVPVNSAGLWSGVSSANVTGGIEIAYSGPSLADLNTTATLVGPNVGARLNLYRNMNVHHTVNINMNGVTAKGAAADIAGGGVNYIDTGTDTIPNPRTYLDGTVTVLGDANRNVFHNDASAFNNTSTAESNLTGDIQTRLIINGQITGAGGFTKTGARELRLTNNNNFSGVVNVLRFGQAAVAWQGNTVTVNGVDYNTFGDGEGWMEYGLTLAGANAAISGSSAINLQRRGMMTLDNTSRLDASSGSPTILGANNNDRINNAATINFDHGWLRIHGGTDAANTESLATSGSAAVNIGSGTNMLDLWPSDGAGQAMTLTIGKLNRSAGAVLRIRDLDATSTFGISEPGIGTDGVRVAVTDVTGLNQYGSGATATSRAIVSGVLGGIIQHGYLDDLREIGYNNANVSDRYNQSRNLQFLAGSHFMTMDGGFLRPLDDSEYFSPAEGILDLTSGAGQNVNLTDITTVVRQNMSINSLRFGPVADSLGNSVSINDGTTLTSYNDPFSSTLIVDGTLRVASGMISSAFFRVGNSTTGNNGNQAETFIQGGVIDFGTIEGVINNQNGYVRFTDGTVQNGNLQIRSDIIGSAGLTKTGVGQVVLDGYNTYTGITTISEGTLNLRNGRSAVGAGGPGNHIKIEGLGGVNMNSGIQIGTTTAPKDIFVGTLQQNSLVLNAGNDLTNFFGDLVIDNADAAGQVLFTPVINAAGNSTLIVNGDIFAGRINTDGSIAAPSAVTNDVLAIDSRIISTSGSSNGYIILRGQIADRGTGGVLSPVANTVSSLPTGSTINRGALGAVPVTNENEVLRFTVEGNDQLNVTMERQHNAAGRLLLQQGVLTIGYDPSAPGNDGAGFWTAAAMSKIGNSDSNSIFDSNNLGNNGSTSQHGFAMGSSNTMLFMSRPAQLFNMQSWRVLGGGTSWIGGINDSGTVTFGTGNGSLSLDKAARFYAMAGGEVNLNMRLNGQSIQKIGRGTLRLSNTNLNSNSDTHSFELGGGTVIADHSGLNVARMGAAGNFTFRGGSLLVNSSATAATTVNYSTDNNTGRVVSFVAGGSEIVSDSRNQGLITLNLGSPNANNSTATLTRTANATANFVATAQDTGLSILTLNFNAFTTAVSRERVISWATYGNQIRTAQDFAMVSAASVPVVAAKTFTGVASPNSNTITSVSNSTGLALGMTVTSTGQLNTVTIGTGGAGYTSAPTVAINGGGGTGATATATIAGGAVTAINITNRGQGYTANPTVAFSGGGFTTTATATATFTTALPASTTITGISGNTITLSANAVATTTPGSTHTFTRAAISSGNLVKTYNRAPEEFQNNTALWAGGMDVSESGGAGFFGVLPDNIALNTLRFDALATSLVDLGGKALSLTGDDIAGAILVSSNTGASNKTISNGTINLFDTTTGNANVPVYANTTITNNTLSNFAPTTGLAAGMIVTGPGIPDNTAIANISGSDVALTNPASSSGTARTLVINRYIGTTSSTSFTITGMPTTAGISAGMPVRGIPHVTSVRITNGGINYTSAPAVSITGGGGSGATAQAVVTDGVVTAILVTAAGSGYTSHPTVSITGGGGTGAAAQAVVPSVVIPAGTLVAQVTASTITLSNLPTRSAPGVPLIFTLGAPDYVVGYTLQPTANTATSSRSLTNVSTTAGLSVGMTVTGSGIPAGTTIAQVNGPTSLTITNNATATATAVALTVNRFVGDANGDNASSPENQTLTNMPTTVGLAPGMPVRGITNVVALKVTNAGSGYTSAPAVAFSGGGGSGAAATAIVSAGQVTGFTVTAAGSGYTTEPSISLSGGGGTGATARAVVPAAVVPPGAFITAVTPDSITLSSKLTITAPGIALITGTTELIVHQYGQGTLNIAATVTGNGTLTISGPTTTNPSEFNTSGTVNLSSANSYTGRTFVNGAVLEVNSVNALGTAPSAVSNNHLTLNGGTLRWTGGISTLGTRGIRLEGSGGVLEIARPDGNLIVGTGVSGTQAQIVSEDVFRGDLIKTGPGTLTFMGSGAGHNGSFQGLLDIRQGSLIVMQDVGGANTGTTSILGTNRSWADGTIFRQGTNVQFFLGNGDNGGDWNIEEYMTFEGGNTFTYSGLIDVLANISGALDGQPNLGNRRPLNLNGVTKLDGAGTTFDVGFASVLRLANTTGYLTGSADIIKDGRGQLEFRSNSPEWQGNLIIRQGTVYAANQADVLGLGYTSGKTITLGDPERQDIAQLLIHNPDGVQNWVFEVNHDINVIHNPTQVKRLALDNVANGNRVSYNGDVTLNDSLVILVQDGGISMGGEQPMLNFNGDFKDGATTSGNITIQTTDTGGANDNVNGRMTGYVLFNGNNSQWTGDITISTNTSNDYDKTSVLRFGSNTALTAANNATLGFNSILQAGGYSVTMGGLATTGGTGSFYGDVGTLNSSTNGSTEIIENAAATPGSITITQTTPVAFEAVWDAKFRDGVLNSQFFAPGTNSHLPSASLSLVKSGGGWGVLTLDNDYTGTTIVNGGILQVGRGGVGDTGAPTALGTTVNGGATIAGTGWIMGSNAFKALVLNSGATASPGDLGGRDIGTLSVSGNTIFQAGSEALMQVRLPTYNAPGSLDASDANYSSWITGLGTDEFANALRDLVTTQQHDMINVQNISGGGTLTLAAGTKITLINEGYTPKAGDVFHLFKAGTTGTNGVLGNVNVGSSFIRVGNETGTDLTLFELGGNYRWDTSLFNSLGVLVVTTLQGASGGQPPSIVEQTTRSPASGILEPGTNFTISVKADSLATTPISFTLIRNGNPVAPEFIQSLVLSPANGIPAGNGVTATFTLVADSNTEGNYSVRAQNTSGSQTSNAVFVDVNDTPIILAGDHPTSRIVNPSLPGVLSNTIFTSRVTGPGPYIVVWSKRVGVTDTPLFTESATAVIGETNKFESSFALNDITEAEQGDYVCTYTSTANPLLTITSNPATLTVRDAVTNVIAARTRDPLPTYQGEIINFSVTHGGEAPFNYQWFKVTGGNPPVLVGTNATLDVTNTTILASPDTYFCRVTNGVNSLDSNSLSLPVLDPAPKLDSTTIASRTMLSGGNLNMTVNVSGRPTLLYQWKKNGAAIAGATTSTYAANLVTIAHGGSYNVEVKNTTTTKLNVPAAPDLAEIVVVDSTTRTLPVLGPVGTKPGAATFALTANVGRGPKAIVNYEWCRRTFSTEQFDPDPEVEGDEYDIIVTNDLPISTTDARYTGETYTGAATNILKVSKAVIEDDGLYVCKVKGPDGVTVTGCIYDVRIYDTAPVNNTPTPLNPGVIGGYYSDAMVVNLTEADLLTPLDEAGARRRAPVSFAAKNLPPGLVINKDTGLITGYPTKAGDFQVETTATNLVGTSNKRLSLIKVYALPFGIPGTFAGPVARSQSLNGNLGGRFEMTVTALGAISGKLTMGSNAARAFKGNFVMNVNSSGVLTGAPTATFGIPATKTEAASTVTLTLSITDAVAPTPPALRSPPQVVITNATIADGTNTVGFTGWRNNWGTKAVADQTHQPTAYVGLYNVALMLPDGPLVSSGAVPQGAGYASINVAPAGTYAVAGRTPDGETITASSFVGPTGQLFVFQTLYKTATKGSILSDDATTPTIETLQIDTRTAPESTDNDLGGIISHVRPPDPGKDTVARTYRSGFGTTQVLAGVPAATVTAPVNLVVIGGRYIAPPTTTGATTVLMGITAGTNNAELIFLEDGENDVATTDNPNLERILPADPVVSIGAKSAITVPKKTTTPTVVNPAATTLKATAATGAFSGTFALTDDDATTVIVKADEVKRPVTFQGLIIRHRLPNNSTTEYGVGYFVIDQMPQNTSPPATTTKNSPKMSGLTIFKPLGATLP